MSPKPFPTKFDAPEESLGFLLWRLTQSWHRKIVFALKPLGLTHSQFVLLAGSAWLKSPSQAELSRFCNVDINVTSQVVRTLERRGLIKREYLRDERSKCVCVTDNGQRIIEKAIPIVEATDEEFFLVLGLKQKSMMENLKILAMKADRGER